jgi:hypothetical protein
MLKPQKWSKWALLAVLLACGLRRHELAGPTVSHLQQREGHWAIVDLPGKAGHVRTIPVPAWVQNLLDEWTKAAGIATGGLFRRVSSAGKVWGERVTEKLVWHVVKEFAAKIGISKLAPHDLRRSCARLCRSRWRRVGADSGPAWPRFRADHRTLPWLHPTDLIGGQRPHRDRAESLNDTFGRVADSPPAGPGKHYGVTRKQWSDPSAMNLF